MADDKKGEVEDRGLNLDLDDSDFGGFGGEENTGYSEEDHQKRIGAELGAARRLFAAEISVKSDEGKDVTWENAATIVESVRPVPWILWAVVRSVYGKSGELGNPAAAQFSTIPNLIRTACKDESLAGDRVVESLEDLKTLTEAVEIVGTDVAAAVAFIHAVCRRVATSLVERIWRPIVDDALLRAHIGMIVGRHSPFFGAGRGALVGFAGRSGLAIQIASKGEQEAQRALFGLASGMEIRDICLDVYGSDPLQVSALALVAGGCNRDIPMGIASYAQDGAGLVPETEQFQWFSAFKVVENIRMGKREEIPDACWKELGYKSSMIDTMMKEVQQVQRKGHGWRWITKSLVPKADEAAGTVGENGDD